jgi:hypothetical protein
MDSVQHTSSLVHLFRRGIRPVIIALLRALPSPEKCGCQARKEWMIKQIEAI